MTFYIILGTFEGAFLDQDGGVTNVIDFAGQWNSFDEADQFAKKHNIARYIVVRAA